MMMNPPACRSIAPSVFAALILLCLAVQPTESSAQVREMTLETLTKTSSAIVLGQAESSRSFWNDDRTQILTEVRIRVDESVVGDVTGETVVTIPGGRVGNTLYEVSDMPAFVDGEQVLVFLWEHPSGRQLVTAGVQGKLEVIADERGGERRLRGAAPLLKDESLAKTSRPDDLDVVATGDVAVEEVLTLIRGYAAD